MSLIDALDQAIYDTVHDYRAPDGRKGAAPLGERAGINGGTLQNKAYFGNESSLTLRESIPVQREADDFRILGAYVAALDHAVIPLGDFSKTSDEALLDLYCEYHTEIGQTAAAIREALKSGHIPKSLVRKVRTEMLEDIQAGMAIVARLEGMASEDADE